MAPFHEAFIFLAAGAEPADARAREHQLARTLFIPVPNAISAASTAATLLSDGLDLLELYGFGPTAAAMVLSATRGEVPVGLVGVEPRTPVRRRAVISPAPDADPATDRYVYEGPDGRMTIVSIPDMAAVPTAALQLVEEGVERIDMCGGLGPVAAAAAIEAIGDRASVGAVMFGFESLPAVASYRARFETALAG